MSVTTDEVVGVDGPRQSDEVIVARISRQTPLRGRVVGPLCLETDRSKQLGGVAGLEVAGDLRPLKDEDQVFFVSPVARADRLAGTSSRAWTRR